MSVHWNNICQEIRRLFPKLETLEDRLVWDKKIDYFWVGTSVFPKKKVADVSAHLSKIKKGIDWDALDEDLSKFRDRGMFVGVRPRARIVPSPNSPMTLPDSCLSPGNR